MGSFSVWHWVIFGVVALLLFGGKGKISDIMGDAAKGIKAFKKGMSDDEVEAKAVEAKAAEIKAAEAVKAEADKVKV